MATGLAGGRGRAELINYYYCRGEVLGDDMDDITGDSGEIC